ncbi:autophagy-related protein 13 isoform X1 [Lethenteron reissneri]|uniref:autophagy-related protein 13 isoform X1 n=2 Tax=Lethenteron reissneri TaxID=7753 RepID=UPI002AB61A90|nr:autophagy-related protein 13 isoform X1 [Lethenteron reissneri]
MQLSPRRRVVDAFVGARVEDVEGGLRVCGIWRRLMLDIMDSPKELNLQDKKDLDKFLKFFALKSVQVIVQARLGERIITKSSASSSGSDWFNLVIRDIPEVSQEAKRAMGNQLPGVGMPMCVEVSLKTCEGDSMGLEVWSLEMNEKCDHEVKVSYTVYNRLSLLLKSLLAVTRVTPAYKLSRKQGHDYVILYRIYFDEVQLGCLGEGFQTLRVGMVGTPEGTITLGCAYRTNLTFIANRQLEQNKPLMGIIIDHFSDNPRHSSSAAQPCMHRRAGGGEETCGSTDDFQDMCASSFSTSPPSQVHCGYHDEGDGGGPSSLPLRPSGAGRSGVQDLLLFPVCRKPGAFVSKPPTQVSPALDLPFASFVREATAEEGPPSSPLPGSPEHSGPLESLHGSLGSPHGSQILHDDFIIVDLKPAFSKDDLLPMDLGSFYREFQNPPPLSSFCIESITQSMAEDFDSLPEKLAEYERSMEEFDSFVETLQ